LNAVALCPLYTLSLHDALPISAVSAIVVYESAFLAEIIRGGLQALPAGQVEAARAMGLGYFQTLFTIQIPQALTNMIPSLLNQLDRKSTRLNSSHVKISYAVFC